MQIFGVLFAINLKHLKVKKLNQFPTRKKNNACKKKEKKKGTIKKGPKKKGKEIHLPQINDMEKGRGFFLLN